MAHKSYNLMTLLNQIVTDSALSITSGSFDQMKTNLFNRCQSRLLSGMTLQVLGIAPPTFMSTQDLSGTPNPVAHGYALEPTAPNAVQKILIPLTPAAATLPIAYFTHNLNTGVYTYIGKLNLTLNTATVHTVRWLGLDDNSNSATGWSIHVLTTNATVANGGYFAALNIAAADFTVGGGTTIAAATTGDTQTAKRVFWSQETGGTNTLQTGVGGAIDQATKTIVFAHATTSTVFYKFVYGGTISTTSAAGVITDYYTAGGSIKTGANAQFGTITQTNTMKLAIPKSSQNPALIGAKCIYLSSASTGFHFLISDLTSGSTTTPSQVSWNKLGTGVDYTAITWANFQWSNYLDCELNYSTSGMWMLKRSINNDPNMKVFGENCPIYSEVAGTKAPVNFGAFTVAGAFEGGGIIYATSTVTGQRGFMSLDIAADQYFVKTYTGVVPPSFIVTPVITVDCANALAHAIIGEYRSAGSMPLIQFKTSSFTTFASGWTDLPSNNNLKTVGGLSNISQVHLRILLSNIGDYNTVAQFVNDIILAYQGKYEVSSNWRVSIDNTSRNGESPVKITLRQVEAYAGGAKTVTINLYQAGSLVGSFNTTTNFSQFKKSTNSGSSFSAMASANDYTNIGDGTTMIEFDWTAPQAGLVSFGVTD